MKKILLLLVLITLTPNVKSQNAELTDNSWYISHIVLDGTQYDTPIVNVVGIVNPNITFDSQFVAAVMDPESDSFFSDVTYGAANDFTLTDMGITLPGCQAYCDFAQKYFEVMTGDFIENIFTYTLETVNETLVLTITSEEGNIAVFNDSPILGVNSTDIVRFEISPNPTSNQLYISSENNTIENISVFNIAGQKIIEQNTNLETVNVSELQNGIYFVEITSQNGKATKRFVKK